MERQASRAGVQAPASRCRADGEQARCKRADGVRLPNSVHALDGERDGAVIRFRGFTDTPAEGWRRPLSRKQVPRKGVGVRSSQYPPRKGNPPGEREPVANRTDASSLGIVPSSFRHCLASGLSAPLLKASRGFESRRGIHLVRGHAHAAGDSPVEESPDSYTKRSTRTWEVAGLHQNPVGRDATV